MGFEETFALRDRLEKNECADREGHRGECMRVRLPSTAQMREGAA